MGNWNSKYNLEGLLDIQKKKKKSMLICLLRFKITKNMVGTGINRTN